MAKAKRSGKDLRAEARDMIEDLPDETAAGRLVHDDGTPSDLQAWAEERAGMRDRAPADQQRQQPT